jgi:hypothetical protein
MVVCGLAEADWLLENWGAMFPGAPRPEQPDVNSRTGTKRDRVKALLRQDLPPTVLEVPAEQVASNLGSKAWRDISKDIMTKKFKEATLPALGWKYETRGKGRGATSWFVRCQN